MIKNTGLTEPGLEGIIPEGVFNFAQYLIPVYGPIKAWADITNQVMGDPESITASQGYYEYTKAYLLANPNAFTEEQIYNIAVQIGRYYTEIQKRREMTPDEVNQMAELSELADQLAPMVNPAARVTPPAYDAGKNVPAPIKIPELNPFSGITDMLLKFKWVFIVAGVVVTAGVAGPYITPLIARMGKK